MKMETNDNVHKPSGPTAVKPATKADKPTEIKIGLRGGPVGASIPMNSLRAKAAQAESKRVEREKQEKTEREADQETAMMKRNRLGMMLDISGSMGCLNANATTKIVYLQRAYTAFIEMINYDDTAIAVRTFPFYPQDEGVRVLLSRRSISLPLSSNPLTLAAVLPYLIPAGGTPMHDALKFIIEEVPLTRGILISDGEADGGHSRALYEASKYVGAEVPIDCVHIGSSTGGENLLKKIAEMTGGIYIKFTNVEAFSQALTYLTPRYRAMLTSGLAGALDIGAKELILPPGEPPLSGNGFSEG